MRLVLRPPGLIRLFSKREEKTGEGTRPETIDPDAYEVTPYGRRPRQRGHARLMLATKIVVLGAAAVAAWMLI